MSQRTSDHDGLRSVVERARTGYEQVVDEAATDELVETVERSLPRDADARTRDDAIVDAASARIERDPAYERVAARVARWRYYRRLLGTVPEDDAAFADAYRESFRDSLTNGVEAGRLDGRMTEFDLDALADALRPELDERLGYVAMETLVQRYFLRVDDEPTELPQVFWMRVAMGLALNEDDRTGRAIEFYETMARLRFVPSTPTLFHAGTSHAQLSSCYLTTVPDDLDAIFDAYGEHANLSKWSGGLGTDWTPVRATGATIESTGVDSTGVVPFLKISNDVTAAINRSGKRRGAACAYLACWHLDFPAFLDLRRNTGDERRRTHDMNTAAWIPDLFVQRVREGGQWTLFSPDEVPDLHETYGSAFVERYEEYEAQADAGDIEQFERVDAADLWRRTLTRLFETGHPWLTFKDPCNVRSPQDHAGVVRSSNLCTEITLNTSAEETAVCNLGSVNLSRHVVDSGADEAADATVGDRAATLDRARLADTVETAMRLLDNVVDLNFYPSEKAERSNLRHRPVGLGVMGFHDALTALGVPMASEAAVELAGDLQERVAYHAILNSARLARERGTYESYAGSKWDRDVFPQDTIDLLERERGESVAVDPEESLDWSTVREHVATHGMRNSNTMAVAPTATISTIAGTTPSVEPRYSNLYVKSNMSGEFTMLNERLVADLKREGLWDDGMVDRLKYHDGSVQEITDVPESVRERHRGAFEIDPRHQIRVAAQRGVWIDQSQSLNVFFPGTDGSVLDDVYQRAWESGLKTTYYLRTLGASQVEKSTLDLSEYDGTQFRDRGDDGEDTATDGTDGTGETDPSRDLPSVEDPTCDACQ
ncbi:ribonucleoside-diphosphate reductase subunit alpha [Halomarina oriensis]|uniref:Ribonucleoside-diphosphate reductase n=1 Tax=Halomarina oriensis TaxID=671145 RepID=A0A6B0GK94_9EURY|nr:ribonucleoside-diphosphate reductase subunit alpha [Halomarina oriensis]MWG34301.1 ribonucleoside-diphosphate reductase subunit alpha [Halomarina oriensis]